MRGLAVLAALLALAAGPARADFEAGMRAANLRDYAGALRAWQPLAEAGEARAQYHLGMLYEEGRGVGRDYGEAARWYRAAARQGHAQAQNSLAILTVQGQGVARDPAEAYRWFALAAKAGNGFAARNLERLRGMLSAAEIAEGEARAAEPLDGSE
jgi:TPR repeat protein